METANTDRVFDRLRYSGLLGQEVSAVSTHGIPFSGLGYNVKKPGPYWPAGEHSHGHDDLCALLVEAACDNARRALRDFVSDERLALLQAAVAAGTAVELTAKAALVQVEPTLLCDNTDPGNLLRLAGKGDRSDLAPTRVKTIGGMKATRLCKRLLKGITVGDKEVEVVLEARNAALHLALVDRDELRAAVATMVRVVDEVLDGMEADRESFWGPHLSVADNLVAEGRAEIASLVSAKVSAAQQRLEAITAQLSPEVAAAVLAQRAWCRSSSDHEEPVECPVCRQEAWLICGVEKGEPELMGPDDDSDWMVPVSAWPFAFECAVCGLSLDDRELRQFEFPDFIDLEPESARPPEWDI